MNKQKVFKSINNKGFEPISCSIIITVFLLASLMLVAMGFVGTDEAYGNTLAGLSTTATISSDTLQIIKDNKAAYQSAASTNKIDWKILPAITFRESSCAPGGPSGEPIGSVNPDSGVVECNTYEECLDNIAEHFIAMAKSVYEVDVTQLKTVDELKNAFLAYNRGSMYKNCTPPRSADISPYVMNQYDNAHKDMIWPSPEYDSTGWWCESVAGQQDARNGALTVYAVLSQMEAKGEI